MARIWSHSKSGREISTPPSFCIDEVMTFAEENIIFSQVARLVRKVIHLFVNDKYVLVPLAEFHFNISHENVLETEL